MMREALIELNANRSEFKVDNPVIRIGCGINTGDVIAGQIGSDERMEYTVIGDPVNLASRVEELCKPFAADILITENTWNLIGDKFITEEMQPVSVKGKEVPVRVFAVVNFKNTDEQKISGPQTLAQVRELLGIVPEERRKTDIYTEKKEYAAPVKKAVSASASLSLNTSSSDGPEIKMTSFGSSAWVKGIPVTSEKGGNFIPVSFVWITSKFNSDTNVIVEVALDKDFEKIIEEREVVDTLSVSILLKPGIYWWRVYPIDKNNKQPVNQIYPDGVLAVDAHG